MTIRATDANNSSAAACGRRQRSPCSPCPTEGPALCLWQPAPRGPLHAAPAHPRAVTVPVHAKSCSGPCLSGRCWPRHGAARPWQGTAALSLRRDRACGACPTVHSQWHREHVLHPARWFSGKKLKGLFFRKPHYSIMFMCSHVHVILFTAWNISSLIP